MVSKGTVSRRVSEATSGGPLTFWRRWAALPACPSSPATATFVNGTWTGNVTVAQASLGMHLNVVDGSYTGTSNTFDIAAAARRGPLLARQALPRATVR